MLLVPWVRYHRFIRYSLESIDSAEEGSGRGSHTRRDRNDAWVDALDNGSGFCYNVPEVGIRKTAFGWSRLTIDMIHPEEVVEEVQLLFLSFDYRDACKLVSTI